MKTIIEGINIRIMTIKDWPAVAEIFRQGIETGNATFETKVPGWEDWDVHHLKSSRLIAEINGSVAGWAALSQVSERCVYGGIRSLWNEGALSLDDSPKTRTAGEVPAVLVLTM
jgi:hypothetical protein